MLLASLLLNGQPFSGHDAHPLQQKEIHMTDQANAAAPKTLAERIELAQANLDRLLAKQRAEGFRDTVVEGAAVTFNYGKKPNVRIEAGTVLAVADIQTGPNGGTARQITILSGEGADTAVRKVFINQVLTVGDDAAPEGSTDEEGTDDVNPLDAA